MEPREIGERVKALNKATVGGEPAANILTVLRALQKGVKPTEDLLRSTKVGVAVNRQKQHPNKEVAQLAGEMVSKWRDDVNKTKAAVGKKSSESTPPSKATNGEEPAAAGAGKITVPPDQRTWKADHVDVKRTGNEVRDNCIGLIYNGLAHTSEESPIVVLKRAVEIERAAITEYGPETSAAYKTKLRSLFQNLKNKSNPQLRLRIFSGDISPERFVVMTHDELKSAERRAEDEKLEKENEKEMMVPKAEKSISTSLTCGKCGQKKVSYGQAQTRSADEPMTTFCECQVCGNRWKFS
ncbi:MAG: RNA polymerase II elongation factor [Caeruleum heppii]|nr:MAG: RNA polymerase II elongation factor [Caeruleum heppii]